ncbi:hypothetical protein HMPREF9621_02094 [Cutibacterium modestum HL037PA2]|nr:hypothetical protein HMPREF9621_02094 [Cutibacterium modestum HL037PA2]
MTASKCSTWDEDAFRTTSIPIDKVVRCCSGDSSVDLSGTRVTVISIERLMDAEQGGVRWSTSTHW